MFSEAAELVCQASLEPEADIRDLRFALAERLQNQAFSLFPLGGKIPVLYTPEIPGYHVRIGLPDGTFVITPKETSGDRDGDTDPPDTTP